MAAAGEHKPSAAGYAAPSQPATGTAYPYAAAPPYYQPPPPPPPQPYYDPNYNAISPARRLFRFFIIACVVFFLLAGIITLIVWLVLRPRVPTFAVSSAAVSDFNVSASNGSDSSRFLSGDFDFTLNVRNPNKKLSVDYRDVNAVLGYGHERISYINLPPFSQGKRTDTVLRTNFSPRIVYITGDSADGILKEKSGSDRRVEFRLRVFARVVFSRGGWRMRRRSIRVHCDDIGIQFGNSTNSSRGSMVGSSTKCHVHL